MSVVVMWKKNGIFVESENGVEQCANIDALILEGLLRSNPAEKNPKSVCLFFQRSSNSGGFLGFDFGEAIVFGNLHGLVLHVDR